MKKSKGIKFYLIRSTYGLLDLLVVFLLAFVSLSVTVGFDNLSGNYLPILIYSLSLGLATVLLFLIIRIYRLVTTSVSIIDSLKIFTLAFIVQAFGLLAVSLIPQLPAFADYAPIWALAAITTSYLLPSIRLFVRAYNLFSNIASKKDRTRTLIIGAGDMGKVALDETRRNRRSNNKVVVFVDDNPTKINGSMAGIPIKGPLSNVPSIIKKYKVEEVIIAISAISKEKLHEIIELLNDAPVRIRRMPLLSEMEGPNDKRIIDVNLDELLCREPVQLDNHEINDMLHGKTVLVTGAGGSIGSELVRQIFNTHPKTLILFDIYENSTYDIQMELVKRLRDEKITDIDLVTLIGSTYNEFRVEQIFKRYKPHYVYHAAAYKHVPLMEDSPAEAIRTNVIGTYNVAKMADKYKAKKMVLVSTDKAVRPTNVMGATKRFAEMIIQYYSEQSKDTAYAAVRFGNVLGSNGSVVPLFKKQIEAGGPVTLTHKDIIRYFMTIPEAVSLILQCGLFANGGEIFILDMGKPVKIANLADKMIRQAGKIPGRDIQIIETGLRPGEKLFEELLINIDTQEKTKHPKIFIEEKEKVQPIESKVKEIGNVFSFDDTESVKELLSKIVTTYTITDNK
jgi:FlaA1/EpsC-like NDP-sugar epimerase